MTLFNKIKSCNTPEEMAKILCEEQLGCCLVSECCEGGFPGAKDCDDCVRLSTIRDLESEYEEEK